MNSFQILGIEETNDFNVIRKAYKIMAQQTHPDKFGGNPHFFNLVQKAYKELEKMYKVKSRSKGRESIEQITSASKGKPCDENKFNAYFEKNNVKEIDPFSRGYRNFMSTDKTREDASELSKAKVQTRERRITVLYEPEAASTSKNKWLDSVRPLGVEKIEDFTCAYGADYMNTHQEPIEVSSSRKNYASVQELQNERENMKMKMTEKEEKEYKKYLKQLQKEDYKRKQNILKNDSSIMEQYVNIHNRLR